MTERRKFQRKNPISAEIAAQEQAEIARRDALAEQTALAEQAARDAETAAAAQEADRLARLESARSAAEARKARLAEEEAARQIQAERLAEAESLAAADRAAEAARLADAEREAERERLAEAELHEQAARDAESARRANAERQAAAGREADRRAQDAVPDRIWGRLPVFSVDARHLERNRIVTAGRSDPAHTAFDVLRTRLLQALADHGWKRVAITSPTKDCGKTFTAANLAISLSRQENCRALLIDCDLRRPTLHKVLGVREPGSMGDVLRGRIAPEDHFMRMGENTIHAGHNIAFGFNSTPEPYASELLQSPQTAVALTRIEETFEPDVVLFDLPPALFFDDVIAFRPLFDGVLLVVGGGLTTDKEIREVERRLGDSTPLLGTVLNMAEGTKLSKYTY